VVFCFKKRKEKKQREREILPFANTMNLEEII
jgi:hypothetical protein